MSIKDKVAIIGVGMTRFGENFEMTYQDMLVEAVYKAYEDAGVGNKDIQAAWLGTFGPDTMGMDGKAGSALADSCQLYGRPVTRVENYCASGMDAVRQGVHAIAAGEYDMVLVAGCEKMRDLPPRGSLVARHIELTHSLLAKGRTAPGMFALIANRYFHQFGVDKTALAKVAVKNHRNGALNPLAHFRKEVTIEQVLKAPMVVDPLGLFDCCPTTDGSAAVILTSQETAERLGKDYVLVRGVGLSHNAGYFTTQFDPANDFVGFEATRAAAKMAYDEAGITDPFKQVDVAECHDCFTITEIVNYEDLGFCAKGEGHRFISEGVSTLEGELPVNTSGGLKSTGHPIGATGVRVVGEVTNQVRGRMGKRQVKNARTGVAHTLGGPGSVSCVIVVGR